MEKYYLAIDIGASSGRHMIAGIDNGKIVLKEIYRFENGMKDINGELCWDHEHLFTEIKNGMKKCHEDGYTPESVGVDTWGVDFVLLDKDDKVIGNTVGYRDKRTKGMDVETEKLISREELYKRTGIGKQIYNSIYQLMSIKMNKPEELNRAESILFTPDYFHYLLSGVKANEYTISTTSQLVNVETKDWDYDLINLLGFPEKIFGKITTPGTVLGNLTSEVAKEVGFNCKVVLPPSHDTASAVLAVPSEEKDVVYISSGTWSLMGVELDEAQNSVPSMLHNMTNEGGYGYRFRYLKNIMGLWMIQSVKKEIAKDMSFAEICEAASHENIKSLVDCYDDRFLAPQSMTEEIKKCCKESQQQVPESVGEVAAVVYNSLAYCYSKTIEEIEELTGKHYSSIHIVGGGSNADYLNRLTAEYTGRTVIAGPSEATAIGNVTCQMLTDNVFKDNNSAKNDIKASFFVKIYK